MKIDKNLYFYPWQSSTENNCNSYFIDGDVPILIDPGHSHLLPHLIRGLGMDGIDPKRIALVINTHGHADHFEASEYFFKSGARITMSSEDEKFFQEARAAFSPMNQHKKLPFQMDFNLQEGTLNLGSLALEIYLTPGHSPGSVCIYWPERQILVSGDLLFVGGIGRTDVPGGNGNLLAQSLKRIVELEIELLLPGHGSILKGKDNSKRNFKYIFYTFLSQGQ